MRLRRAEELTAAIIQEIDIVLPEIVDRQEVFEAIREVFIRNGAYIMTDKDRKELGLEAKDLIGWTMSERVKEEQNRLFLAQMFLQPITISNKVP